MGSEDPSHGGRRSVTSDRADPFESMREQMEKERENFFKGVNPRDWPNENNTRGGLFNRAPRTSFGGFPSGPGIRAPRYVNDFPEELDGFGLMPGSGHSLPRHRKSSSGSGQNVEDDVSDHSSNCSGNSNHSGETETGIPINVVHEKTLPRNKYGQAARNTTELPAKASGNESPRLERAHSEPPNKFKQRLNLANPLYSTIPENSESSGQTNRPMSHLDSRNPLKASASAPSVPSSSHQAQESHPVPPPRRSPPRNNMSNPIPPAQPTNSGANVRHIPIFVEGRPEPIFNTNVNVGQQEPAQNAAQDLYFPKRGSVFKEQRPEAGNTNTGTHNTHRTTSRSHSHGLHAISEKHLQKKKMSIQGNHPTMKASQLKNPLLISYLSKLNILVQRVQCLEQIPVPQVRSPNLAQGKVQHQLEIHLSQNNNKFRKIQKLQN